MRSKITSALARGGSLLLTFCTGATALVYEVTWQRYLANFLGSSAQATSIILAVFLGGLCVGYQFFGKYSRNRSPRTLLAFCGISELLIGLWALIFPSLYHLIWDSFDVVDPASTFSLLWEFAVSIVLIAFPTILMGGTLPLLTQGLSTDLEDARRFHARVYAWNTAGAFIGCLAAGFYFLPYWGLSDTIRNIAWLNIGAGIFLAALSSLVRRDVPSSVEGASEASPPMETGRLDTRTASWVAAIAGFCSLCLQTVFIRLIGITMGSSEYAFSMIVAVFVCMLAFGSWLVSKREKVSSPVWLNQICIFLCLVALYPTISRWPYVCYLVRVSITSFPETFYFYHGVMFLLIAAILALPVGLMGATMPRIFASVVSSPRELGSLVGRLYAWNTIGCVLGSLLGGYWLLYILDLDRLYKLCLLLFVISAALSFPRSWILDRSKRLGTVSAIVVLLGVSLMLPRFEQRYLGVGLFRERRVTPITWLGPEGFYDHYFRREKLVFYRDGPNTTVAVAEHTASPQSERLNNGSKIVRNLVVNGKSDGETSFGDTITMRLCAHLPLLLSENEVANVAVVGFGLGVAAGSSTLYPEVKRVDVMEIAPAVIWAAPFFDFANYEVTKNPKIHIILGDAYRTLASSQRKYDVIISEPSNPWVTGVERLFSREFYTLVKKNLAPTGIYAQWIHNYTLSERAIELVFRTFMSSFPNSRLFRMGNDLILLGSAEPLAADSIAKLKKRYSENELVRKALSQVNLDDPAELLGLEEWANINQFPGTEIQTLEFPRLALIAGRDFFVGNDSSLQEIFSSPVRRLWGKAAGRHSLVSYLADSVPDKAETIAKYARAACDSQELQVDRDLLQKSETCKTSLVASALEGFAAVQNEDQRRTLELIATLKHSPNQNMDKFKEIVSEVAVGDIQNVINLFESFDSVFVPLSAEKLIIMAAPCLTKEDQDAIDCRTLLVKALATTGHTEEAKKQLKELTEAAKRQKQTMSFEFLQFLIANAEVAFPK